MIYGALTLFNDPRGYLGSDTGGKVAALEAMAEQGRLDPDLGYWADQWDPEGRVHPIVFIGRIGDRWVDATTLPALYAAVPLYRLGGYRMALLVPMAGAVLAALAARALARRCSSSDGAAAFWVVGLGSPIAIYALDFWEHSLGVSLMAWAMVLIVDVLRGRRPGVGAFVAGVLFGLAATMRTEALVYAFVAVAAACSVLLVGRRDILAAVRTGFLSLIGAGIPLLANTGLEMATVGGAMRSVRATGTASAAATAESFMVRLKEAGVTAFSFFPVVEVAVIVIGIGVVGLLAIAVGRLCGPRDAGPAYVAMGAVVVFYGVIFRSWPMFIPGMLAASPIAVVGLLRGWGNPTAKYLLGVGVGALPLVWATEYVGGAGPQWGGRYILTSGLLFVAVGATRLPDLPPTARRVLVGLAVVVTAMGVVMLSQRSHGFGGAGAELAQSPEPVLVSRVVHLAREGGSFYGEKRWLTVREDADVAFAAVVVERAGVSRFGLVTFANGGPDGDDGPVDIDGWRRAGNRHIDLLPGAELLVTTYVRDGAP